MFGCCTRDFPVEDMFFRLLGHFWKIAWCCQGLVIYIIISVWNVGFRKFLAIGCFILISTKGEISWNILKYDLCSSAFSKKQDWQGTFPKTFFFWKLTSVFQGVFAILNVAAASVSLHNIDGVFVWLECCSFVPFHVLLTGVGDSMSNPVLLSYSTFF